MILISKMFGLLTKKTEKPQIYIESDSDDSVYEPNETLQTNKLTETLKENNDSNQSKKVTHLEFFSNEHEKFFTNTNETNETNEKSTDTYEITNNESQEIRNMDNHDTKDMTNHMTEEKIEKHCVKCGIYKEKIKSLMEDVSNFEERNNDYEQLIKLTNEKYKFIKKRLEEVETDYFNIKISNNNKTLLEQIKILQEENNYIINEFGENKKQTQLLLQEKTFLEIELENIKLFMKKYRDDTNNYIKQLENKYGLDYLHKQTELKNDKEETESEDEETIKVFVDDKGIKKMTIGDKNYKLINQSIDIDNEKELQKEYTKIYNKYIKK
jgi:hypothetical protein